MNNKRLTKLLVVLACFISSTTACQSPTMEIKNLKVEIGVPTRASTGSEEIPLNNCNTDGAEIITTLGAVTTIQKFVTVNNPAIGFDDSEHMISEPERLNFEIEIDNIYQPIYLSANSRLEDIKLSAIPGYITVYTIEWEKLVYREKAAFSRNNDVFKIPYTYELIVPKIIYQEKTNCLGTTDTPIQSPQLTITSDGTSAPTTTGNTVTLITDNVLFKGPNMAYGPVSLYKKLAGEKFAVIARNPYGDWFLVVASDGTKGWLYFVWIEFAFDPDLIPVATDIPPLPPTQTRRPNDETKNTPYP